ncbi:GNAT family N-acetyltransferase [Duganella sp. LX20W]|uniref:GNAT family N-acetyltransferase n=1 Tax=Rugamonas brunnea TaxID=2758569 RepID=A0A7W2EQ70_9BURK|nr:GNAT family N-acetyltransferase [Rugamonas brunnea]MBA5636576.1 GNAT family N-acetyltransferase [Rugamonas brunnea]
MLDQLDNVFWHALSGPQAHLATGAGAARRYAPGFSPIIGFAIPEQPDFAALAPFCQPGELFYCAGWSGAAPDGWAVEVEAMMICMVWRGALPAADDAPDAIALGPEHVEQAVQLAALTKPGPFGPRTLELGDYYGYVDGDRLIAMAGERSRLPGLREISGVCTHPDYQGRGLARRLMFKLIRNHMLRDEQSFLHVMAANEAAHQLYLRMGFADYRHTVVRVVARTGQPART